MKRLERQLQASIDYVAQRKRAEAERERRNREERLWTDEELMAVHLQLEQLLSDAWLRAQIRRRSRCA